MRTYRLRSKRDGKTKKRGGAGRPLIDTYCALPEIPVEDDGLMSGAKLRKYSKYFMCNPSVLTAEEKKSEPYVMQETRIKKMGAALCDLTQRPAFSLADFESNPNSVSVNDLTDGTRCLLTNNYFSDPFKQYYRMAGGPLLSTAAGSFHNTFYQNILPKLCTVAGTPPYLQNPANPPVFVPLTRTNGFSDAAIQEEWKTAIFDAVYNGGKAMYKFTPGSQSHNDGYTCPQNLLELNALSQSTGRSPRGLLGEIRFNNVIIIKKGGVNYIVKRYTRFSYKERSDLEMKGCDFPNPILNGEYSDKDLVSVDKGRAEITNNYINEKIKGQNPKVPLNQRYAKFKDDPEFKRLLAIDKANFVAERERHVESKRTMIRDPSNADFTKDLYNDDYEYRESFTNLIMTNYLNTIYGSAAGAGKSYVCPMHYALLFVPTYTSTGGIYSGKTANGDVFFIQEAMSETFENWVKTEHRSASDMLKFMEYAEYLDNCLNYNEILPAYASLYSKFIKYQGGNVWNGTLPVFIRSADCKADNIMINSESDWKFIDIDGMQYSQNPSNSQSTYIAQDQVESLSPYSCIIDEPMVKNPTALDNFRKIKEPADGSANSKTLKKLINQVRYQKVFSVIKKRLTTYAGNDDADADADAAAEDEDAELAAVLALSRQIKGGKKKTLKARRRFHKRK